MSIITLPAPKRRLISYDPIINFTNRNDLTILTDDVMRELLTNFTGQELLNMRAVSTKFYHLIRHSSVARALIRNLSIVEAQAQKGMYTYNRARLYPLSLSILFRQNSNEDRILSNNLPRIQESGLNFDHRISPGQRNALIEVLKTINRRALPIELGNPAHEMRFQRAVVSELNAREISYLAWSFDELLNINELDQPENQTLRAALMNCVSRVQLRSIGKILTVLCAGQLFDMAFHLVRTNQLTLQDATRIFTEFKSKDASLLSKWPFRNFDLLSTPLLTELVSYLINENVLNSIISEKIIKVLENRDFSELNANELLTLFKYSNTAYETGQNNATTTTVLNKIVNQLKQAQTDLSILEAGQLQDLVELLIKHNSLDQQLSTEIVQQLITKDITVLNIDDLVNLFCNLNEADAINPPNLNGVGPLTLKSFVYMKIINQLAQLNLDGVDEWQFYIFITMVIGQNPVLDQKIIVRLRQQDMSAMDEDQLSEIYIKLARANIVDLQVRMNLVNQLKQGDLSGLDEICIRNLTSTALGLDPELDRKIIDQLKQQDFSRLGIRVIYRLVQALINSNNFDSDINEKVIGLDPELDRKIIDQLKRQDFSRLGIRVICRLVQALINSNNFDSDINEKVISFMNQNRNPVTSHQQSIINDYYVNCMSIPITF